MAKEKEQDKLKQSSRLRKNKKTQTVRERSASTRGEKPNRIRKTAKKVAIPLGGAKKLGGKEYHLPLPDNKAGRVLRKRVPIIPKFFSEAFAEVKQVTWPDRKTTIRLTMAVFIFAVVFASIVGLLDFVLGKIFKELFVK